MRIVPVSNRAARYTRHLRISWGLINARGGALVYVIVLDNSRDIAAAAKNARTGQK